MNSKDEQELSLQIGKKAITDKENEITATEKALKDNEEKMNQLLSLHLEKKIPTKGFEQHYNPLFEQSEALEKTLTKLEKELQKLIYMTKNFDLVSNSAISIYDTWDTLARAEKRLLIESVVKAIYFNGQEITFKLRQMATPFADKLNPDESHRPTM